MNQFEQHTLRAFAEAILRDPDNPYECALKLTGDVATSLELAKLTGDPKFIAYRDELYAELGDEYFLPSKADLIRAVMDKANKSIDPETAFKGYKLAADMMGYIEKPKDTTVINNTSLTDNRKVMLVQDFGADGDWEKQAQAQQAKLIEDASRSVN